MIISGALAGMLGVNEILGVHHKILVNFPIKTPCTKAANNAVKVKAKPVCIDAQFIALSVHKAKVVSKPAKEKVTRKDIIIKNKIAGILKRFIKSLKELRKFIETNCLFLFFGSVKIKYAKQQEITATTIEIKKGVL